MKVIKAKAFVTVGFKTKKDARYFYKVSLENKGLSAVSGEYSNNNPCTVNNIVEHIDHELQLNPCECDSNDGQLEWKPCLKCKLTELIIKKLK